MEGAKCKLCPGIKQQHLVCFLLMHMDMGVRRKTILKCRYAGKRRKKYARDGKKHLPVMNGLLAEFVSRGAEFDQLCSD